LFALAIGGNPKQNINAGITHYKSVEDWKNNLLTTANARPPVLYALDAKTGKMLYQSGAAIKSWVHFSGLGSPRVAFTRSTTTRVSIVSASSHNEDLAMVDTA
jgi:outer membrane protein assembly factor BamB